MTKLKKEIATLGLNLTRSVPKSSLLQIYEQLLETNPGNERNNEIREQISGEEIIVPGDNPIKDKTPNPPAAHDPNISMSVQGLQGLFTTMQGTIASLQSTVVALQHKQSGDSSTSTNQLDKFYNNLQQQSTIQTAVSQYGIPALNTVPATNASSQHGVPADSLPHIDVITDSVRKNVTAGKYVNPAHSRYGYQSSRKPGRACVPETSAERSSSRQTP